MRPVFDSDCRRCSRLSEFLDQVKLEHPDYFARPVPPFGDKKARLLVVGLAPGMHGANATGRPFTGDYAGILLYETLYKYGFSSKPESVTADDGLKLKDCRITNAVKCLPPQNKPLGSEINTCNQFLTEELKRLPEGAVIVALGLVAHNAVLKALGQKLSGFKFAHLAQHAMPGGIQLIDSYHCSRYNTQTRRLTPDMFYAVFDRARKELNAL
ncbi:MAG: uracil-DNA glycosylase [Sedimenticola sp.]|nr:uracil-DNA glycosylase [Sedimenticola sp.]